MKKSASPSLVPFLSTHPLSDVGFRAVARSLRHGGDFLAVNDGEGMEYGLTRFCYTGFMNQKDYDR
mgnify:CR=1 FL=1